MARLNQLYYCMKDNLKFLENLFLVQFKILEQFPVPTRLFFRIPTWNLLIIQILNSTRLKIVKTILVKHYVNGI